MKSVWRLILAVILLVVFSASFAIADHRKCPKKGKGDKDGGFSGMVSCEANCILKNKKELGLTEDQIAKIEGIKLLNEKDAIKAKAEIEVVGLDIKAKMKEDPLDVQAVTKLINQKYELKKQQAQSAVKAYADIKSVLTDEQKGKLKDIWGKCKKDKKGAGKGMKCPMKE